MPLLSASKDVKASHRVTDLAFRASVKKMTCELCFKACHYTVTQM